MNVKSILGIFHARAPRPAPEQLEERPAAVHEKPDPQMIPVASPGEDLFHADILFLEQLEKLLVFLTNQSCATEMQIAVNNFEGAARSADMITSIATELNSRIRNFIAGAPQSSNFISSHVPFLDLLHLCLDDFYFRHKIQANLSIAEDVHLDDIWMQSQLAILKIIRVALHHAAEQGKATFINITFQYSLDHLLLNILNNSGTRSDANRMNYSTTLSSHHYQDLIVINTLAQKIGGEAKYFPDGNGESHIQVSLPLVNRDQAPGFELLPSRIFLTGPTSLFLDGLERLFVSTGIDIIGCSNYKASALEKITLLGPDIVIMDISNHLAEGLELTRGIKCKFPGTIVVVLSDADNAEDELRLLQAGASAYLDNKLEFHSLLYEISRIVSAERKQPGKGGVNFSGRIKKQNFIDYLAKEFNLNAQQLEILKLLAEGKNYREIADKVYLTEVTIKYHMKNMLSSMNLESKQQLVKLLNDVKEQ